MCHFLFVGIPADSSEVLHPLRGLGLSTRVATNPHLGGFFPSDHSMFVVTRGSCSCDLYVDSMADDSGVAAPEEGAARRRYQRKGWSDAKIERALDSMRKSRQRPHATFLLDAVRSLLGDLTDVYLYVHWFDGPIETEPLPCSGRVSQTLAEFVEVGGRIREDELVRITR